MAITSEEQPSPRRKACDLCFTKKIKCDMLEPLCSNCRLYEAECQTSMIRSRARPPKPRHVPQNKRQGIRTPENMHIRMETIEGKLQEILEGTKRAYMPASGMVQAIGEETSSHTDKGTGHISWSFDPVMPRLYYGSSDEPLCLPPLDDIMPVVDRYFTVCNHVMPLFDQSSFMQLVTHWYSKDPKRDRPTWAAILVVVALGLHSQPLEGTLASISAQDTEWIDHCMRGAQSVVPELVAMDEDILGIQILLSLAMLFRSSSDLRAANVLLGIVVTLSHRMQLHSSASTQYFTAEEVEQRSRVFWMIYILDKTLSLRLITPPLLSDAEIDIPRPPVLSVSGIGAVRTKDGHSVASVFRLRVDLASIEEKVYQHLYSGRSTKIPSSERQQRVAELQTMLNHWYAGIPPAFRIETVCTVMNDTDLFHMTQLYHDYLACIIMTNGVYSSRAEWMQMVGSLSRAAIHDYEVGVQGPRVYLGIQSQNPPLRSGWSHCVDVSRATIKLFDATTTTRSLIWQCCCPHFSAIIILLANVLMFSTRQSALLDLQAVTESLQLFDRLHDILRSRVFEAIQRIIMELHKSAVSVMRDSQADYVVEAGTSASPGGSLEMNLLADEASFLGFELADVQHGQLGGSFGFQDALDNFVVDSL